MQQHEETLGGAIYQDKPTVAQMMDQLLKKVSEHMEAIDGDDLDEIESEIIDITLAIASTREAFEPADRRQALLATLFADIHARLIGKQFNTMSLARVIRYDSEIKKIVKELTA